LVTRFRVVEQPEERSIPAPSLDQARDCFTEEVGDAPAFDVRNEGELIRELRLQPEDEVLRPFGASGVHSSSLAS
jgi:hypothetical protein